MRERTETEVVEHLRAIRDDFFSWKWEVLATHLSADAVREFCKPDADLSDWTPRPLHVEAVFAEFVEYLDFAWGKALDERGISAERSVDKLGEFLWLLGEDEVLARFTAAGYAMYGAPKLAVLSDAYNRPIPDGGRQMAGRA